ncbi:MAG: serine/threonine-protein kinase RsbT [Candidatus Latescibacterota bacterium]|jgi:serine/threonine-protein kinase RsbT
MEQRKETWVRIQNEHDVLRAVMEAGKTASTVGFDASASQMISTAVSELARNIMKYAGKGEVIIRPLSKEHLQGVEIKVQDRGQGIEDVEKALDDHYSTSGTLGLGLPGVKRLMDDFEIESTLGEGTRVTIRKWL